MYTKTIAKFSHPEISQVLDHEPHAAANGRVVGVQIQQAEYVPHIVLVFGSVELGSDGADELAERLFVLKVSSQQIMDNSRSICI